MKKYIIYKFKTKKKKKIRFYFYSNIILKMSKLKWNNIILLVKVQCYFWIFILVNTLCLVKYTYRKKRQHTNKDGLE